jgi:arylsulfatase A-like enzyme
MNGGTSQSSRFSFYVIMGLSAWAATRTCAAVSTDGTRTAETRANVILITISTLRADHTGCLGYDRATTPHLDRFAERSILFRNAFATSGWMMPAHGSLFTSLYPSAHGATHIDKRLGTDHETLAEILAANGYYCVGFCCGPRLDAEHGFAQGFHVYDDRSVVSLLRALEFEEAEAFDINRHRTNDLINDAALSWLANNRHSPFFLFVHYYDNHWDYVAPEPYRSLYDPDYTGPIDGTAIAREPLYSNPPSEADIRHMVALYDGEVRQTDEDLGEMLAALEEKGWIENSIIIVAADHGEEFYEHGHTSHHGVHDELIHIPLVISVPHARSKSTEALASQVDILPTILDYLDIALPVSCRGKSLRPIIEGRAQSVNDFIFAEYTGGAVPAIFAVRSLHYKCCASALGGVFACDLTKDPEEMNRIARTDFNVPMRQLYEKLSEIAVEIGQGNLVSNRDMPGDSARAGAGHEQIDSDE